MGLTLGGSPAGAGDVQAAHPGTFVNGVFKTESRDVEGWVGSTSGGFSSPSDQTEFLSGQESIPLAVDYSTLSYVLPMIDFQSLTSAMWVGSGPGIADVTNSPFEPPSPYLLVTRY